MSDNIKIVSFPYIGKYTPLFKEFLEGLGSKVILPPKITDKTIKIGARHSSEMMCFPYKVTLGNFIEVLENHPEIDYLVMYDSRGQCRFRHYHILQKQALNDLGYKKIKMIALSYRNLLIFPKRINPKLNIFQIIKNYWQLLRKIKKTSVRQEFSKNRPNVLIMGEVYTCLETSINYNIEDRLEKFNINFVNSVDIFSFIKDSFLFGHIFRKNYRRARKYLNGPLGGHGIENIESLLEYTDKGIDGAIWLRPLSCMPETTIDPIIKKICQENNIPLLVFDIDESNFSLSIETRLETFVEQVKLNYETGK